MISCYLDDSGTTPESHNIVIAGYFARLSQWSEFERHSKELFKREKLSVPFHSKEFFSKRGEFKDWDWLRQTSFAFDWFNIAADTVIKGITVSLPRSKFYAIKKQTGLEPNTSIYGQCFKSIIDHVIRDADLRPLIQASGLSVFVEAGNKNNNEIVLWFNKLKNCPQFCKYLKVITLIPKNECRAIQLADYLAFFSRRFANEFVEGNREMHELLKIAKDKVNTLGMHVGEFATNPNRRTHA